MVSDVRPDALHRLKSKYKIRVNPDNRLAVDGADIVLLAVKPQQMPVVLEAIAPRITRRHLVLSIAAGITTSVIEKFLTRGVPTIRIMPNTPALVGAGAAGVSRGRYATVRHENMARSILETVGIVVSVPEKLMDAVTAVSGSGPAYVFYLAEAMKQAGIELGLSATVADQLVRQTIRGAGLLLAQSPDEPQVLRQRVTSPGGTTEAALKVLESSRVKTPFPKR